MRKYIHTNEKMPKKCQTMWKNKNSAYDRKKEK